MFACFKHGLALSVYFFFSLILSVSPRPFLSPSSSSPVQIVSRAHYQSALVTSVVHNLFWSCLCSLSLLTIAIMLSLALFSMNNELCDRTRFFSPKQLFSFYGFRRGLSSLSFFFFMKFVDFRSFHLMRKKAMHAVDMSSLFLLLL